MTGKPYSGDFPLVTVRDSVMLHSRLLVEHLGVREVFAVVGGSMGGMQALEWTFVEEPPVHAAVALACNGKHNAWQIGFSGKQACPQVQGHPVAVLPLFFGCKCGATVSRQQIVTRTPQLPGACRVSAAGHPGRPTLHERAVSRMPSNCPWHLCLLHASQTRD